ncbi:MAG: SPFH domain-containing protein [Planctomycetota bacterium]|jgi:regulator of protease activity HflC (stomatin/prohibitin superfamily)
MPEALVVILVGGLVVGLIALSGLFTVAQQTRAVLERFGRYLRTAGPGLHWRVPIVDRISGRISHRVQELEIKVESKTADDVFVDLLIAVQYMIGEDEETVKAAFYRLSNPQQQISSYVFDTVRALVPEMPVDHVFAEKDKIAGSVKERLQDTMRNYGYTIVQSLVNDIQPDAQVKEAMNKVNASARLKEAARNEAEAEKIRVIAEAEAEARAKELQGIGIAKQRLAIANGLKESVEACAEAGIKPEEATKMVLLTQHYDTVTAVGAQAKSTIMMIPYTPDGMSQVGDQITSALLVTDEARSVVKPQAT